MKVTFVWSFLLCTAISFAQPTNDRTKIRSVLNSKTSVTWLFTGNSITQGAKHTHGLRAYPEIFAERIRWEMGRSTDIIINTAISGHTSQDILNGFVQRISRFNPNVVILMIGTNDAATQKNISISHFEDNLVLLINEIRNIPAIPVLLTPNPIITDKDPERKNLDEYVDTIRAVAKRNQVILVDNWSIWKTDLHEKYQGEVFRELLNDPLHPNGQGHKEIAVALFKELSIFEEKAPTCGGKYYEGDH